MSKNADNPGVYVKFLNLVRAMTAAPAFPVLNAAEERLLNQSVLKNSNSLFKLTLDEQQHPQLAADT